MKLYDTFTRSTRLFEPLDAATRTVTLYVCGPTVYDAPHLGHARSAYLFDVLRRHLERGGYRVRFVRNVTDVDDKIIEKAKHELASGGGGSDPEALRNQCRDVAERYLKTYHEAMDALGIRRPDIEPKATEHVTSGREDFRSMTDFIAQLLIRGVAYEAKGDVYFSVRKFEEYGRLSRRHPDELRSGARVEPGEDKEDPLDFALWKAAKPGEPFWDSPWGRGRPGWHIECSAMSTKYLGDAFDIHGGGVDLVFPHHENEIAQAQAAGKPFARCWVHNGLLTVNGEKMSKSLGNVVTVDQALQRCRGEADVLKVLFASAHYRSPVDYTREQINAVYQRWFGWTLLLEYADNERSEWERRWAQPFDQSAVPAEGLERIQAVKRQFEEAMDDDLSTPRALACLDELTSLAGEWRREPRIPEASPEAPAPRVLRMHEPPAWSSWMVQAADTLLELGRSLGFFDTYQPLRATAEQQALLREREAARARKDFITADRIRRELEAMGLVVEDTRQGPVPRRKR